MLRDLVEFIGLLEEVAAPLVLQDLPMLEEEGVVLEVLMLVAAMVKVEMFPVLNQVLQILVVVEEVHLPIQAATVVPVSS